MKRLRDIIECLLHGHIWWPIQKAGWSRCLRCKCYRNLYRNGCVRIRDMKGE